MSACSQWTWLACKQGWLVWTCPHELRYMMCWGTYFQRKLVKYYSVEYIEFDPNCFLDSRFFVFAHMLHVVLFTCSVCTDLFFVAVFTPFPLFLPLPLFTCSITLPQCFCTGLFFVAVFTPSPLFLTLIRSFSSICYWVNFFHSFLSLYSATTEYSVVMTNSIEKNATITS